MKIVHKGKEYVPIKLSFNKSDKPRNNKLSFAIPIDYYSVFSIDDDVFVYSNDGTLLFNGYVVGVSLDINTANPLLNISAFDKESLMFNRIWSETVTESAPIIIGQVLSKVTNDLEGSRLSRVTIKFVGYPRTDGIQVTTTEHPEIEFTVEDIANNTQAYQDYVNLPSSDKFKRITYGAMMKPVYEWVRDLSQDKNTGVNKVFVWYLDENNIFRWYATSSITNPPTEHLFVDYKLETKQEDKVNFIIAYLGDDLNGAPIYIYAYKDYSGTPNIQESIKDWADIARDLKDEYTNNTAFREAVKERGYARARAYFESETLGRISGEFTLYEPKYRIGDILNITHAYGVDAYKIIIKNVNVSFDLKKGEVYTYGFEEVIE